MCLSMPEEILRDLLDFRRGIGISSHIPLTLRVRNIAAKEDIRDMVVMGERLKVVTYKYRENLTLDFIQPLNNDSSVLCMYRIQFLLQSDEINSVVYMLYL
jgi:hypothetical protein